MCGMAGLDEEWSSLVSDIHLARYGTALQKLETILFSRDAGSMLTTRLRVSEMLRHTAFDYLKAMTESSVQEKLDMLQFLLAAFTCTHDIESQLVIRYEDLVLQEFFFPTGPHLHDYIDNWICFAEDCLHNGFLSNAIKGFDKALVYLKSCNDANQTPENLCRYREKYAATQEMKDLAQNMLSPNSVQVEATKYIKQMSKERPQVAQTPVKHSALYRYGIGIKKRNLRKLQEYQHVESDEKNRVTAP